MEQLDILDIMKTAEGQELCLLCSFLVATIGPASEQMLDKHLLNDRMAEAGSHGHAKHFHEAKSSSAQSWNTGTVTLPGHTPQAF